MAKRQNYDRGLPTLHKLVPHWVAYVLLAALLVGTVKIVQVALGIYY